MKNETFTIKEVTELLDIEAYVLRYYEKELKLNILRNAQGHRIYTLENIELIKKIKDLREQGLELKAIKNMLGDIEQDQEGVEVLNHIESTVLQPENACTKSRTSVDITNEDDEKVKEFRSLIKDTLKQALTEYHDQTKSEIKTELKEEMSSELDVKIAQKINALKTEQQQKEEEHYKSIDTQLRELREARLNTQDKQKESKKEKSSFFKKLFKSGSEIKEINLD